MIVPPGGAAPGQTPAEYAAALEIHIKAKRPQVAYGIVEEAIRDYPGDPLIASYLGLIDTLVGNTRGGLKTCCSALEDAKKADVDKSVRSGLHLNLGRSYLASGQKKEAVGAFRDGLLLDRKNKKIYWELRKLGVRRKPVLPFLKRSNFINRFLGILFYRHIGLRGTTIDTSNTE